VREIFRGFGRGCQFLSGNPLNFSMKSIENSYVMVM